MESLQFRKIGKVYTKPKSKIQMLQNVDLAFKAIVEDNIRLVNIGKCARGVCSGGGGCGGGGCGGGGKCGEE